MPSVSPPASKNAQAVHEKHKDLLGKYSHHLSAIQSFQQVARGQLLDNVTDELELNNEGRARAALFLDDFANLFRFYRRSRYSIEQATALLKVTLLWRIRTDLDLLSLSSLHPLYVTPRPPTRPLFWVNSAFKDFYGRPCGLITLRSIERTAENSLDEVKEYVVGCMEIMRRYIGDLYRTSSSDQSDEVSESTVLQMTIGVDLAGSGMANLELELLPFLLDLLKNHVPGMVGAVYILNYGWVHAGMWAVIKRVLPQQALAKIFFLSYDELKDHFAAERIPKAFHGELDLEIDSASNDVLRRYGRPRRTSVVPGDSSDPTKLHTSSSMSRTSSYDSIYEVFYSADSTPWASRSMTPRHSEPSTPRGTGDQDSKGFTMTPSAARKLKHLQMSRGDLSSAAEHAQDSDVRAPGRMRSDSNPRIENGRAVGLNVSVGPSPYTTPFMTPAGPLSPRTPRSRNMDRHVRFSSPRNRSLSPPRRIGTSSSFTLYLPEREDETALPSESEESDASGKDGEKPVDRSSGLLYRLRLLSETRRSPTCEKVEHVEKDEHKDDGTLTYIEPGSPQLQVPHLDEPPLQNVPHTFLSHRTRRAGRDGHVSPYHANNPYFGYPAYIDSSASHHKSSAALPSEEHGETSAGFSLNSHATPRHLHVRRRKRDLLRTLTYLFVLRILALHRRVRWRVALVWREAARTFSVGGRAGVAGSDDGDEFWRKLDARRHSSTPTPDKSKKDQSSHMWTRLSTAFLFIMLVRPQWRHRLVTRVYAMIAPIVLRPDDTREAVNWDEWDQRVKATAPVTTSTQESWTGLHLRKRLGLKSAEKAPAAVDAAGGGGGGRSGRGQRYNPMAVAGGLFAAASLSYLLYNYLASPSSGQKGQDEEDDDAASRRGVSASTSGKKQKSRPSMSLCLSTSFDRSAHASMTALRRLLERIAPLFVVHLIVPGNREVDLAESIASLAATLDDIPDFDTRRILEYTQFSGRFALSRALACDCHVEISLPQSNESGTTAELEKIRRSCGLVVFAALPPAEDGAAPAVNVEATLVLEQLKRLAENAGQPDLDAPPGMRAYNSPSWSHLATQLSTLRQGWN